MSVAKLVDSVILEPCTIPADVDAGKLFLKNGYTVVTSKIGAVRFCQGQVAQHNDHYQESKATVLM